MLKVLASIERMNIASRPPEIAVKKELTTKESSLCRKRLMPIASAATSSSRIALKRGRKRS